MLDVGDRLALRLCALIATAVVCVGAAACGSDDNAGADGGGADAATPQEREIRATIDRVDKALKSRDTETACAWMTDEVRRQVKQLEGYKTCAKALSDFLTDDPTGQSVLLNAGVPPIEDIRVAGGKATVVAKRGGKTVSAELVREGRQWQLSSWFTDQRQ